MIRKLYCIAFFFLLMTACQKKVDKQSKPETFSEVKSVLSLNYEQLKPYLEKNDGKTYVVNFWATWCAPCVKELPFFERLNEDYKDKNVKVILVSLDFPKKIESQLLPFLERKKINSTVYVLDDPDANSWIEKIDKSWSGAIPATIIYKGENKSFYEKSFTYEELEKELILTLNK